MKLQSLRNPRLQTVAALLASCVTVLAAFATSSCQHCADVSGANGTVGECANPKADAGPDGGARDDFADCHLTPSIAAALGGNVPKSGENCDEVCTAALGRKRAYTVCGFERASQSENGPSLWQILCDFPPEQQCGADTVVPTN